MPSTRRSPLRRAAVITLTGALVATAGAATAAPASPTRLTPRTHFHMEPDGSTGLRVAGAGIPNIDSVKSTIRAYYDATDPAHPGIANKTSSPYISEMKRIAGAQWKYLAKAKKQAVKAGKTPAIVFDADDTTLWTYDMEDGAMGFNFDPVLQNEWVQDERFRPRPRW